MPRPLPGMHSLAAAGKPAKARTRVASKPNYEDHLAFEIRALRLPAPVREYRFAESVGRKFRFDLAWPDRKLALEVEGGGFVQGRHGRGMGMENDCEKHCLAVLLGFRVMRVTPRQVKSGQALRWVWQALGGASAVEKAPPGSTPAGP